MYSCQTFLSLAAVPLIRTSSAAERDLKRIGPGKELDRLEEALYRDLPKAPRGEADVKSLVGHRPWLRLRVGDYRVIFRPLRAAELKEVAGTEAAAERGYLVERIIHRRDLERAVRELPLPPT